MRGVICYYSGSGNTKLACKYIAANVQVPFDLVDVVKEKQKVTGIRTGRFRR